MFCQVIVDINHEDVDRVFTYRVPKGMTLCPGIRRFCLRCLNWLSIFKRRRFVRWLWHFV